MGLGEESINGPHMELSFTYNIEQLIVVIRLTVWKSHPDCYLLG